MATSAYRPSRLSRWFISTASSPPGFSASYASAPALGERVGDPPVPAGEIEQLHPWRELEQRPNQLRRGPLRSEELLIEVEVVVVEGRRPREFLLHRPALPARVLQGRQRTALAGS
jgi:hypothetical protein